MEPVRKFRLFSGRVLVEPIEPVGKSAGGIIIPDTAKEKPCEGIVLAVADEPHHWENGQAAPVEVKAGDRVLYGRYAGNQYTPRPDDRVMVGKTMLKHGTVYMILAHNDCFAAQSD